MKKIIVSLAAMLLLSCDPAKWGEKGEDWYIYFVNNSDKDVIVMMDFIEVSGKLVPSTTWSQNTLCNYAEVKAKSRYQFELDTEKYEYKAEEVFGIYVFSPDTLAKYTWSRIKADRNYLARYECVIDYIKTIEYP